MKFRRLCALSISAAAAVAMILSCSNIDSVNAFSNKVVSDDTQAKLYRFLQTTRAMANEEAKQYLGSKAEYIRNAVMADTDMDKALQDYCSDLLAVAGEREKSELSKRDALLQKLKAKPTDGVGFAANDEDLQEQQSIAAAINLLTKSMESLTEMTESSADEIGTKDTAESVSNSVPDRLNVNDSQDSSNFTEDELNEIILCTSTPDNVPDGVGNCDSTVRSFMAFTAVTSKRSAQYALLYGTSAYTDANTGIRMVDGRYCIAVGSGYTKKIGTKIDLVFEDGSIIKCILGDCKSDKDTDVTHRYCKWDGSVAEFIIDKTQFNTNTEHNAVNTAINQYGKIKKVVVIR